MKAGTPAARSRALRADIQQRHVAVAQPSSRRIVAFLLVEDDGARVSEDSLHRGTQTASAGIDQRYARPRHQASLVIWPEGLTLGLQWRGVIIGQVLRSCLGCRSVMKELIHQYGAWIVFALCSWNRFGLPLPGEAILVSAAIFAGTTQELGIALVLLSAVLGAILGSTIGFWIGSRYGYPLLLRYGFNIELSETKLRSPSICFGVRERWLSSLRDLWLCCDRSSGSLREQTECRANFVIANSAGAVAWALFWGLAHTISAKVSRDLHDHSRWRWPWSGPSWWSRWSSLAAQGTGACGCGRAAHSRAVAGGTVGKGRWVILPRI